MAGLVDELHARLAIVGAFPALQGTAFQITSQPTPAYNCIAWAGGDDSRGWWPKYGYWPAGCVRALSIASFIAAFESLGYTSCDDGTHQAGYEKVVIYALNGEPLHAARQLADGSWTSKLGEQHDISHQLDGLNGDRYGYPTAFLRRQILV